MNYADTRPKFQSGDLFALTHTSWKTLYDLQIQAVRVFTESEYAHVGMIMVFAGRIFVVEAVTPFVRLVPLSKFAKSGFYWIPMNLPPCDAEVELAFSMVGVATYSRWEAVKAFFKRFKVGTNAVWECAEAVITWRAASLVPLGDIATPTAVVRAAQGIHGAPVYLITA